MTTYSEPLFASLPQAHSWSELDPWLDHCAFVQVTKGTPNDGQIAKRLGRLSWISGAFSGMAGYF